MSKVSQLPPPATPAGPQKPEVPTLQVLIAQRTTLVIQRSAAKDQIEAMERSLQVVTGMISIHESYVKDDKDETTED